MGSNHPLLLSRKSSKVSGLGPLTHCLVPPNVAAALRPHCWVTDQQAPLKPDMLFKPSCVLTDGHSFLAC